jgi:O-antigen ligase/Flp pilus assembly protein TadD
MSLREKADRFVQGTIEAIVLVMVCLSPWAFASVEPPHEFLLYAATGLVAILWGVRMLLQGQFTWKKCPVALCLAALFLLGFWQLQPLPRPVLQFLSPHAVQLYDELLPSQPEELPFGEAYERPPLAAGNSLSLYPGATRRELIRLLAVFLLFAVVRNNIASAASLRRLDIALVVNGSLLAFFAIIQFFTSPRDTIYWTVKTPGAVFGPFVCRTHFPFYLNVCIGAGIGLLLSRSSREEGEEGRAGLSGLLHDPPKLWLCCGLALMVGSVLLSLSRGGFLALLGALTVLLLLRPIRSLRFAWSGAVVVSVALALALVAWLGYDRVETRLSTIWTGQALEQSRWPLWADGWPLVQEFPLLGTGFGTYGYAEPLHRSHMGPQFFVDHVHNEYLEALVEGGIVRLAISLTAIGLVGWFGYRAVRRHAGQPLGGLALGALFGFVAVVLHSVGDFGLHLPAIAVLVTVLCAQLAGTGAEKPAGEAEQQSVEEPQAAYVFRAWGLAPVAGMLCAVGLGLNLSLEGLRVARVRAYRLEAARLQARPDADKERRLAYLDEAAQLAPSSGRALIDLAQAHLDQFEERRAELDRGGQAVEAAQWVLRGAGVPLAPAPLGQFGTFPGSGTASWDASAIDLRVANARSHLLPGLATYLRARDVCPLLAWPQVRVAANVNYLAKADPRAAYLERAKRVITNDPNLWFLFGAVELVDGQKHEAARSWRRALELSDQNLLAILSLGKQALGAQALLDQVLPDRPDLLVIAAERLYPKSDNRVERRPFLEKALKILQQRQQPLTGDSLLLQARLLRTLGRQEEATQAYQQALSREPRHYAWRLEVAAFLCERGDLEGARRELLAVLRAEPGNGQALQLLSSIELELRRRPSPDKAKKLPGDD